MQLDTLIYMFLWKRYVPNPFSTRIEKDTLISDDPDFIMRIPINLSGKKYDNIDDDNSDEVVNKMSSKENKNRGNTGDDNNNNNSNNNDNISNGANHSNDRDRNGSKNTTANKFGVLSRLRPNLTRSRNQPIPHSPRTRTQSLRCRRENTNTNTTPTTPTTIINDNDLRLQTTNLFTSHSYSGALSTLGINSNIALKHRDSLEDSSDLDNDNDADKRRRWRKPLTKSDSTPSMEDSGFSSSNCLSDDKDDNGNSFDRECEDETISKDDSVNSIQHPFPLSSVSARRRARTYSLDSTSSDLSDSNTTSSPEINSKLSLSLPKTCTHKDNSDNVNNKKRSLSTSEHTKQTTTVVKKRSFRNKSRRNATNTKSTNSIVCTAANPLSTVISSQPLHAIEKRNEMDGGSSDNTNNSDHNNNNADVTCKNLSSYVDASIPFRFGDLFRCHGLFTLVACILYTLFLMFVCGGMAISWTLLKKCISKSDLKDLRENLMESRRRREIVVMRSTVADERR